MSPWRRFLSFPSLPTNSSNYIPHCACSSCSNDAFLNFATPLISEHIHAVHRYRYRFIMFTVKKVNDSFQHLTQVNFFFKIDYDNNNELGLEFRDPVDYSGGELGALTPPDRRSGTAKESEKAPSMDHPRNIPYNNNLEELCKKTKFTRKEIQLMYRSFKQVGIFLLFFQYVCFLAIEICAKCFNHIPQFLFENMKFSNLYFGILIINANV